MSLLGDLARRPLRGLWLLRRLLVELRGIRRALERQADALEISLTGAMPGTERGQTFRSYSRLKEDLADSELKTLTDVSYVEVDAVVAALAKESELRLLMGRDPTAEEIERALHGERL